MVPFAIGSETAGSITYPASRCGATALRPTFGSVGRTGVMSLSESLVISSPHFCSSLWVWCSNNFLCSPFNRTSLVHSVEMLLIVRLFWMPSEGKIQMTFLQETFPLVTHSLLISQSLQLVILTMLTWRLDFIHILLKLEFVMQPQQVHNNK